MKVSKEDRAEAEATLRKYLKPGTTVYTVLRHVSRSGMRRRISVFVIGKDRRPLCLDWAVSRFAGWPRAPIGGGEGVQVNGCGMDMGFHIVYTLSAMLFRDDKPGDKRGGYVLRHEWL